MALTLHRYPYVYQMLRMLRLSGWTGLEFRKRKNCGTYTGIQGGSTEHSCYHLGVAGRNENDIAVDQVEVFRLPRHNLLEVHDCGRGLNAFAVNMQYQSTAGGRDPAQSPSHGNHFHQRDRVLADQLDRAWVIDFAYDMDIARSSCRGHRNDVERFDSRIGQQARPGGSVRHFFQFELCCHISAFFVHFYFSAINIAFRYRAPQS